MSHGIVWCLLGNKLLKLMRHGRLSLMKKTANFIAQFVARYYFLICSECEKKLGVRHFEAAYDYLKKVGI